MQAGVHDSLVDNARSSYDRIFGLDHSGTAVDDSVNKGPGVGEARRNSNDGARRGWKSSLMADRIGNPIG